VIIQGDALEEMRKLDDATFTACFCDPPYGLQFMGKAWDHGVPGVPYWAEVLRLLKPGAVLMAFGGTRTYHRLACAIEEAGFEIFDCMMWLHGQGFPKSHNLAKATGMAMFEGYGTALKPAWESVVLARKPRTGTYAQMALEHGTAALNIDGARVETNGQIANTSPSHRVSRGWDRPWRHDAKGSMHIYEVKKLSNEKAKRLGRWPANLLLSHSIGCERRGVRRVKSDSHTSGTCIGFDSLSERQRDGDRGNVHADADGMETIDDYVCVEGCPVKILGEQSGWLHGAGNKNPTRIGQGKNVRFNTAQENVAASRLNFGDSGTAARFFQQFYYTAKASRAERDAGLEGFDCSDGDECYGDGLGNGPDRIVRANKHPTVKPLALCKYLATLIRPPEEYLDNAALLVPFAGSGSEMIGAYLAGWRNVTGIELEQEYVEIGHARIAWWRRAMEQTGLTEPKAIIKAMKKPLPMFE